MGSGGAEQVRRFLSQHADTLQGVVHSAGVLSDNLLRNQNWEEFETVLQVRLCIMETVLGTGVGHLDCFEKEGAICF